MFNGHESWVSKLRIHYLLSGFKIGFVPVSSPSPLHTVMSAIKLFDTSLYFNFLLLRQQEFIFFFNLLPELNSMGRRFTKCSEWVGDGRRPRDLLPLRSLLGRHSYDRRPREAAFKQQRPASCF